MHFLVSLFALTALIWSSLSGAQAGDLFSLFCCPEESITISVQAEVKTCHSEKKSESSKTQDCQDCYSCCHGLDLALNQVSTLKTTEEILVRKFFYHNHYRFNYRFIPFRPPIS